MNLESTSLLVVLATVVFFGGIALEHFGFQKDWLRVSIGVSAVVLALVALATLVK